MTVLLADKHHAGRVAPPVWPDRARSGRGVIVRGGGAGPVSGHMGMMGLSWLRCVRISCDWGASKAISCP